MWKGKGRSIHRLSIFLFSILFLTGWGKGGRIEEWLRKNYLSPKTVRDREGRIYTLPKNFGGKRIPVMVSQDGGKSFHKVGEIKTTLTYRAWGAHIFTDGETLYLVWTGMSREARTQKELQGRFKAVFFSFSSDRGRNWSKPVIVNDRKSGGHNPKGFVDSKGIIYVCWKGKENMLYLSLSRNGGKTWEGPWDIRRGDYPGFTESEGTVFLTYAGKEGRIIFITYTRDSGKTWETVTPGEFPLIIENPLTWKKEGKFYVVFRALSPAFILFGEERKNIYYILSPDGEKWKGPVKLSP